MPLTANSRANIRIYTFCLTNFSCLQWDGRINGKVCGVSKFRLEKSMKREKKPRHYSRLSKYWKIAEQSEQIRRIEIRLRMLIVEDTRSWQDNWQ